MLNCQSEGRGMPKNIDHNQTSLFTETAQITQQDKTQEHHSPLAHKSRPDSLAEFIGQKQAISKLQQLKQGSIQHIIFWGPPGVGKTTLAKLSAKLIDAELYSFNAVLAGVKELRSLIQSISDMSKFHQKKSILFIDEIHRFNKAQQDALLPHLEAGDFILMGATTEYPQTSLNRAILSRVNVIELFKLTDDQIETVIKQTLTKENKEIPEEFIKLMANHANGDARSALNSLSNLIDQLEINPEFTQEELRSELLKNSRHYDKGDDRHYDVISAFIKSIRGSDADAAMIWLAIMLDGGEDPEFIARRLIILASEDIGNANPQALTIATNAHYAVKNIGMPEARIPLAQAVALLSASPKSNSSYLAIDKALDIVRNSPTIEVPTHLRNHHPDKKNYKYAHSYSNHWVEQDYLPKSLAKHKIIEWGDLGAEKNYKNYLKDLKK